MISSAAPGGFVTVPELAKKLGVSAMTVYRMTERGDIPSIRVGRSIRIPLQAAEEVLRHGTPPPREG